ncbi:hypothetical protein REC12_24000 [Desulfosporosinus sp. PR]|uniref:hypothetical protein n=1 Tax=Candidatus Desulfosporosinus nitrosoreducens TaxID=3401928 RepID=UPI0027F29221|nr:hypothetical protein [Desulfosporosinus sp. PR]MDQ7096662.1 hypothetical protein [Desulfosporosinus sp. PR]
MKNTKHGIIGGLLIFASILIGTRTETGFSLGDKLFLALGIAPWTNGQTGGIHLPFFIVFALFIIGCLEARRVLSVGQTLLLLAILLLLAPPVLSSIKPLYYMTQNGLNAIEYDTRNSHFQIYSENDNQNIDVLASITLSNYGKDTIQFGLKIPPNQGLLDWPHKDLILKAETNSQEQESFILYPGETKTFLSLTVFPSNIENNGEGQGTFNGPNLILFKNNESRLVGFNL